MKSGRLMGWLVVVLVVVSSVGAEPSGVFSATLVVKRGGTTTQQRVWIQGKRYRTELDQKGNFEIFDGSRFYRYSASNQSARLIMDHPAHPGAPWISWATYATTLMGSRPEKWGDRSCLLKELEVSWVKGAVKEWELPGLGVVRREYPDQGGTGSMELKNLREVPDEDFFTLPQETKVIDPRDPTAPAPLDHMNQPMDWTLRVAGGQDRLALSSLRGKVVLMNFFATWCGPCRGETPDMVKVYRDYKDKGVAFVTVDVGEHDKAKADELVAQYIKEYGVTWPIAMDESKMSQRYAGLGIPVNFFLDKNGVIRSYQAGGATEAWFRAELDRLLTESKP